MINSIWPEGNGHHLPLPAPNVNVARSGMPIHELSPESVKGIIVNPIYTGVGRMALPRSRSRCTFPASLLSASFYDTCESCLRFSQLLLKPRRAFL